MTAVLAERVGPDGHITAVDAAGRDYGSPQTLGQATDLLKASPHGDVIDFRFDFDLLHHSFETDQFDAVVFAHCAWYFPSAEALQATLASVRPCAKALLFAEWDLTPTSFDQLPHMLAVFIQGQIEAFKTASEANIQTPLSVRQMKETIGAAGWTLSSETHIDTEGMQDADWEIRQCLNLSTAEAKELGLPPKVLSLLAGQMHSMKALARPTGNLALPGFAAVFGR